MSREYVPLFLDFNDSTQDLADEECGRLVRAIIDYANGREYESRLVGAEKIAFRFLKGAIDRNQAISEVRAKAGASRKKTEQTETNESKNEQNEQTETNFTNKKRITKNKKQKTKNENDIDVHDRFEKFWTAYPRKENKQKAIVAFEKINPDDLMLDAMLQAIERQKASSQWQEEGGRFIPHPTTWLNGRRWEDEVQTAQPQKKVTQAQQYEQRDYAGFQDELEERFVRMTEGA